MVSTTASQQEGRGFLPRVGTLPPCLCGFPPGALVSPPSESLQVSPLTPTSGLVGRSKQLTSTWG